MEGAENATLAPPQQYGEHVGEEIHDKKVKPVSSLSKSCRASRSQAPLLPAE
jgi:hypothetical protein